MPDIIPSWTTILDAPPADELTVRDLSTAEPITDAPGAARVLPYTLADGTIGEALWGGPDSPDFGIDPALTGWHAIFFSVYRPDLYGLAKFGGVIKLKLASAEYWIPFSERENREIVVPNPGEERPKFCDEPHVELELFLGIGKMDGERVFIRNSDSCVTALRFVPMADAQVAEYHADIDNPETRRIIISCEIYGDPVEDMLERISRFRYSGVDTVHLEFTAGNFENVLYGDSKVTDAWGANITDAYLPSLKPGMRRAIDVHRAMIAANETPFDRLVPAAHAAGIKVMATSRMAFNLMPYIEPVDMEKTSIDDYGMMFNGPFHRGHPEFWMPSTTGGSNLDYFHPEVRENVINIFCEAAERLGDIDGMCMDFRTWPPFIRKEADVSVMTEFVKELRRRLDAVGTRLGRRLMLAAEFVDGMYNLTLPEQRIDVEAWLSSGAVDYIAIEAQALPMFARAPSRSAAEWTALGERLGVPVYPRNDRLFVLGLEPEICGASQPPLPPGLYTIGHDAFWGDEFDPDPMGVVSSKCGSLHYQMGVQKHYENGANKIVLANAMVGQLGWRRLGNYAHLRALNAAGRVFGQIEGRQISWTEAVSDSLAVTDVGPWRNGALDVNVRLSLENIGRLACTGLMTLGGCPPEVVENRLPKPIPYSLEPGEVMTAEFALRTPPAGFAVRAETDNPAVSGKILDWRPESWELSSVPAITAIDDVEAALANESWQHTYWLESSTARVRLAAAGDDAIVLHAIVAEPQGLQQRSKLEVFIVPDGGDAGSAIAARREQSQAFKPLTSEPHRVSSWLLSDLFDKADFASGDVSSAPCRALDPDWRLLSTNGIGFEDVHGRFGSLDGICYLANRFRVAQAGHWEMQIGHDGGVRVWVDGEIVVTEPTLANPAQQVRSCPVVELDAGEHDVVIAFDTGGGNGWGFFYAWAIAAGAKFTGFPLPVAFEQFSQSIVETDDGYEVKAIMPRALFGLDPGPTAFDLEILATSCAADFGWHTCGLFGTAQHRRYIRVEID